MIEVFPSTKLRSTSIGDGMAPKELACEEEEGGWRLELREQFTTLDEEGSGFIELEELREALEMAGFKVPGWRIRDIMDK